MNIYLGRERYVDGISAHLESMGVLDGQQN